MLISIDNLFGSCCPSERVLSVDTAYGCYWVLCLAEDNLGFGCVCSLVFTYCLRLNVVCHPPPDTLMVRLFPQITFLCIYCEFMHWVHDAVCDCELQVMLPERILLTRSRNTSQRLKT